MHKLANLPLPEVLDELPGLAKSELKLLALQLANEAIQLNEKQEKPERLDFCLELIVQVLLYLGEHILDEINQLDGEAREILFKEWNTKTKAFVKHIRMPHDFAEVLNSASESLRWEWAVICAQSFVGANPSIEMHPEYAEERHMEAFDLMMRVMAKLLENQ